MSVPRLAAVGSVAATTVALVAGPAAAATPIHLIGTLSGTWTARPGLPDTGAGYQLTGAGRTNYGSTKLTGTARGTGFIRQGYCTAALTLAPTAGKGRVTVDVTSTHTVAGGDTCQGGYAFTWTVEKGSGTGQYAGRGGHGTGYLDLTRAGRFSLRLQK